MIRSIPSSRIAAASAGSMPGRRDDPLHRRDRRHPDERLTPELGVIGEQDDLRRGLDHGPLGVDLLERGVGQAALHRDAVHGDEGLVDVELVEGRRGEAPRWPRT